MVEPPAVERLTWHPERPAGRPVVAIGTFDGVHLGHQAVLKAAGRLAREAGAPCVAFTFDPHPRSVLQPERALSLLCTLDQRLELLRHYGADACAVFAFDRQVASLSARRFVEEVLVTGLGARLVVAGFNFAFGKGRSGTADTLRDLGAELGFSVSVVGPVSVDGRPVSSTAARALIQAGQVREARAVLGRPYAVRGRVVRGEGRGRRLGYPTANVEHHPAQLLPADGVYMAYLRWLPDGTRVAALAVVSVRPTFGDRRRWLEVHALKGGGDWYGRPVEVEFLEWLRPIRAFASVEELVARIEEDRRLAEEFFRDSGADLSEGREGVIH